jgi:hypothetical protein
MVNATDTFPSVRPRHAPEARDELVRLRAENARLRSENRDLRVALDAHAARIASSPMYGPLEMTAGTCVGPRRRRHE